MKLIVKGKTCVIRKNQIQYDFDTDFECDYKKHHIYISKLKENDFYITVKDKTGMYAVDGGFGGEHCRYGIKTIEDCLKLAIENIL